MAALRRSGRLRANASAKARSPLWRCGSPAEPPGRLAESRLGLILRRTPAILGRQHRFRVRPLDKGKARCAEFAHLTMSGEGRSDSRLAVHLDRLGTDQHANGADLRAASPDPGPPQQTRGELLDMGRLVTA